MRRSVAQTMDIIGDAWSALILRDVFAGLTRFDQLRQDLEISSKTLSARLEHLVGHGILERRGYTDHPPRHDYVPTQKGAELFPVIAAVMAWGDRWTAEAAGPPAVIHHRCGAHARPGWSATTAGNRSSSPTAPRRQAPAAGPEPGPGSSARCRRLAASMAERRSAHFSGRFDRHRPPFHAAERARCTAENDWSPPRARVL